MSKKRIIQDRKSKLKGTKRLDQIIRSLYSNSSRSKVKNWILDGLVKINGKIVRVPDKRYFGDEHFEVQATVEQERVEKIQNIPIKVVYEDEEMLFIDKQSNLVMYPGQGHPDNTLLNALLYHYPNASTVTRAGIVHRLDKDTTGLVVVAKNEESRSYLIKLIKSRKMYREYEAIVHGIVQSNGTITAPIARHRFLRTKMAIDKNGKSAITHYRVLKKFHSHTWLKLHLESGRTHQIRVHLSYINHPIVGDPVYTSNRHTKKNNQKYSILDRFKRQALHATSIRFLHPKKMKEINCFSPLPNDMMKLIESL